MNKKTITITVAVIIVLALAFMLYPKNREMMKADTPAEALDKSTQDDTTSDIDADLDEINVNASSSEEFNAMDAEIKSI